MATNREILTPNEFKEESPVDRLTERVSYLKGMAEGLSLSQSTPEGKVMVKMLDLLEDVIQSIQRLQAEHEDLGDYVSAIDEDLNDLENEYYADFDGMDLAEFEDDDEDMFDEDDDAIGYIEVECPNCQDSVFVDEDIFEDEDIVEVLCPRCQTTIFVNDEAPTAVE